MAIRLSTGLRNNLAGTTGFASTFANGVIEIRTGTQPASADNAASGTLLGIVTLASGAFTPGTLLPIVDERTLLADEPDELIVLPWHFRDFFVGRYRLARARLVFPLPVLEVVSPTPSTPSTRESA